MDGWKTTSPLGRPIFKGYVSCKEDIDLFVSPETRDQEKGPLTFFLRCLDVPSENSGVLGNARVSPKSTDPGREYT